MSSSAINQGVLSAKISNVQNVGDSSAVCSTTGDWSFKNATATATNVFISNSGNVGVGATPSAWSAIKAIEFAGGASFSADANSNSFVTSNSFFDGTNWKYKNSASAGNYYVAGNTHVWRIAPSGTAGNNVTWTQAMTLDASGNLLVGKTSAGPTTVSGHELQPSATLPLHFLTTNHTNGTDGTFHIYNRNASFNGYRFYALVNGGLSNYSANNVNISDERTKTDISLASNYLEKICAIPVKTFRYKDQGDDMDLTLGVIAQDVEKIAPELVNTTDGFGDLPEDGVPLKTIYQTDLQYALMKCIQELKEKNDALEARLAALESK